VPVRAYLGDISELAPATRKHKRATVSSFCRWAVRHDLLLANPMDKIVPGSWDVVECAPSCADQSLETVPSLRWPAPGTFSVFRLASISHCGLHDTTSERVF
jgi:hypothetical protein